LYSATAARALAMKLKLIQREESFLAGLLADIGMLALDQVCDNYGELCRKSRTHAELAEIELDVLGLTHADASGLLARQWKLPAMLAIPMGAHHRPEAATDAFGMKMAQIVHIAGLCADVFVEERAAEAMLAMTNACNEKFAIAERDAESILSQVTVTANEVAPLFEVSMQPSPDLIGIAVKAAQLAMSTKFASIKAVA
jgi:HD-like signal output (HDOD) protein